MALNLGTVVFSGNIQSWYRAGSGDVINTFSLRRAEFRFVGDISPTVGWTMMIDAAKPLRLSGSTVNQSTALLQDAFITLRGKRFELQAGQFLLPLTYEGSKLSSALLEAADRSLLVTDGRLGQVRDIGAQVSGFIIPPVTFELGVFNSTGDLQNTTAVEDAKAIVGRLEVKTPIAGLSLGTSGAWTGRDSLGRARHDRIGGDVEYRFRKLGLRSEFMHARDSTDVRLGAYGLASYSLGEVLLVGRYDYWDKTRTAAAGNDLLERDLLAGFAWFIEGTNVQLRGNYIWRLFGGGLPRRNQVIVSLQAAW